MNASLLPTHQSTHRPGWQIPLFLLGLLTLGLTCIAAPMLRSSPQTRYDRAIARLDEALAQAPPDPAVIIPLIERLVALPIPDNLTEARRIASAKGYQTLVEAFPYHADAKLWNREVWEPLIAINLEHLDPELHSRRGYRLAKALAREPKTDVKEIIKLLLSTNNCGDDPAEGSRLLGLLYLRDNPPDLKAARDAFRDFFAQVPIRSDPRQLAETHQKLGEVLVELGEYEEARRSLEKIASDSPVEIFARSRLLLAKIRYHSGEYESATRMLESLLEGEALPADLRDEASYIQAQALARQRRTPEALQLLGRVSTRTDDLGQAARIRLAEWTLPTQPDAALSGLTEGLRDVSPENPYHNRLIPVTEVRALVEQAVQAARLADEHDRAVRAAQLYAHIGEPARSKELLLESLEHAGQRLREKAATLEPTAQKEVLARSQVYLDAAAKLNGTSASKTNSPTNLRRSLDAFVKAGDRAKTVETIDQLLALEELKEPDRRDLQLLKAETFYQQKNNTEAIKWLDKLPPFTNPQAGRDRLLRASIALENEDSKHHEEAIKLLEANLDPDAADAATHEKSLYRLAYYAYQKLDFTQATVRFQQALQFYPEGNASYDGEYRLALCHWYQGANVGRKLAQLDDRLKEAQTASEKPDQLRRLERERDDLEPTYRSTLKKAFDTFTSLEERLSKKGSPETLTHTEGMLLQQAAFKSAACLFALGEWQECVIRYDRLAKRYDGKIDSLVALSQLWQCYAVYLKQAQEARFALTRLREAYGKIDDKEFNGSTRERTREFWEDWLRDVEQRKTGTP